VITTNLPLIFPLFRSWLSPLFSTVRRSSRTTYKNPTGFRTIGGGGGDSSSRNRRGPASANHITGNLITCNASEERIVDNVKMDDLKTSALPASDDLPTDGIFVSSQIEITREQRNNRNVNEHVQRVLDSW
jgi:hypothetical protein